MSTSRSKERIAFIGGHGHHCLRGLLNDPELAEKVGAIGVAGDGRDDGAAREMFAPLLSSRRAQWFDDPLAMLETFNPTAVSVGGVYGHNAPLTVEALRRDLPVVCEKPLAATREQLAAVRRATDGGRRVLITQFTMRSSAAYRAAREAVRDGEIGSVVLATAQKSYRFGNNRPSFYSDRTDYGSTILWAASHAIDIIAFTTGQPFTAVSGAHGNLSQPAYGSGFEDHAAVLLKMRNGGAGVVHADFLRPAAASSHGDDRLRLAGVEGALEVRNNRCLLTTKDRPERDITDRVTVAPIPSELLEAVRLGGSEYYNTPDTLQIAEVLLAARDAADSGRWEPIEETRTQPAPHDET